MSDVLSLDEALAALTDVLDGLRAAGVMPLSTPDASGNPGAVAAGELIESSWGNAMRDRIVRIFPTVAARDAVTAINGELCVTTDTDTVWQRMQGVWANRGAASSGAVPRHFARAYRTSALTVPTGYTTIVFDTEAADPDNCYNPATGEYTAPLTGVYQINANLTPQYNNNPQQFIIAVFLDGTPTLRGTQLTLRSLNTNDPFGLVVAGAINMAAGNKLTVRLYNSGANPCAFDQGAASNNMLSVFRVP